MGLRMFMRHARKKGKQKTLFLPERAAARTPGTRRTAPAVVGAGRVLGAGRDAYRRTPNDAPIHVHSTPGIRAAAGKDRPGVQARCTAASSPA